MGISLGVHERSMLQTVLVTVLHCLCGWSFAFVLEATAGDGDCDEAEVVTAGGSCSEERGEEEADSEDVTSSTT